MDNKMVETKELCVQSMTTCIKNFRQLKAITKQNGQDEISKKAHLCLRVLQNKVTDYLEEIELQLEQLEQLKESSEEK